MLQNLRPGHVRLLARPFVLALAMTLVALAVALHSTESVAADDRKDQRDARRYEALLQRYEQERSQWQTERAELQKKLADSGQALAAQKVAADKATEDLEQSARARGSLQKTLAEQKQSMSERERANATELATKDSALAAFTKSRTQERLAANARFEAQKQALDACTDQNQRLVTLGHELLERYRDKGLADVVKQKEPFLGIGDTEMFNRVQDYRSNIDDLRVTPGSSGK